MNNYKTSAKGIQVLKHFEGLRLQAYQDSVGVWTIGYGTTSGVARGQVITEAKAEQFLQSDLVKFENAVIRAVKVPLKQHQFDALVVFSYNVGSANFQGSTMLKLINAGQFDAAAKQFVRWNKAGGQVLNGLTRRRESEAKLFSTGVVSF